MHLRKLSLVAGVAIALAAPLAHAITTTPVFTYGNNNGSERCITGNSDGSAGGTCGLAPGQSSNDYFGDDSITAVYAKSYGSRLLSISRVDDDFDKLWFALDPAAGVGVRIWAHYLSNSGDSFTGFGTGGSFTAFAGSNDRTLLGGGNRVVTSDLSLTQYTPSKNDGVVPGIGAAFFSDQTAGFSTVSIGASPTELLYRSPLTGNVRTYSSNDEAGTPYDNIVSGGSVLDHMITYRAVVRVTSGGKEIDEVRYLVNFERVNGDDDFQDSVWELRGIAPVPEPSTYAMLGVGLLAIGALARRRARIA